MIGRMRHVRLRPSMGLGLTRRPLPAFSNYNAHLFLLNNEKESERASSSALPSSSPSSSPSPSSSFGSQQRFMSIYGSDPKKPFSERMQKTGRPLSGHVGVYLKHNSFPLIAISSITNRATAAALSFGVGGVGVLGLMGVDVPQLVNSAAHTAPFLVKFTLSFPLIYHYVAGVRHYYWDKTVEGFTNEDMHNSSLAVLGGSSVLAVAVSMM